MVDAAAVAAAAATALDLTVVQYTLHGRQVRQGLVLLAGGLGVLISLAGLKNEEPQSVKSVRFGSACWA